VFAFASLLARARRRWLKFERRCRTVFEAGKAAYRARA
jgi:hypothetical protein